MSRRGIVPLIRGIPLHGTVFTLLFSFMFLPRSGLCHILELHCMLRLMGFDPLRSPTYFGLDSEPSVLIHAKLELKLCPGSKRRQVSSSVNCLCWPQSPYGSSGRMARYVGIFAAQVTLGPGLDKTMRHEKQQNNIASNRNKHQNWVSCTL